MITFVKYTMRKWIHGLSQETLIERQRKDLETVPSLFVNDELMDPCQRVVESENKYLACPQNSRLRQIYKTQYLDQQKLFDSCYSKGKTNFERQKQYNIEHLNTENPREFWESIKRRGHRKKTEIPMEVYDEPGHVNNDINCALNTWSKEYETLFQGYNVDDFDSVFYNFALGEIERMGSEQHDDIDMWYNKDIDEKEVKFVLKKARLKKLWELIIFLSKY